MFAVRIGKKKRKKRTRSAILLARAGTQTAGGEKKTPASGLHLSRERTGMVQSHGSVEKPPLPRPRRFPCDSAAAAVAAAAAAAPNRIYSSFAPLRSFPVLGVFMHPSPKMSITVSPFWPTVDNTRANTTQARHPCRPCHAVLGRCRTRAWFPRVSRGHSTVPSNRSCVRGTPNLPDYARL